MALDDYFANPSQDCLARLFDAVNSMDISMTPLLTRYEKLIMRTSERKDVFVEKFEELSRPYPSDIAPIHAHKAKDSVGSHSSFEEGILMRAKDDKAKGKDLDKKTATSSSLSLPPTNQQSPSDASFSLDGSAVWVESGDQTFPYGGSGVTSTSSRNTSIRGRKSTDASSSSSSHNTRDRSGAVTPSANPAGPVLKDTHFYPATIEYNDHQLPIRLPLSTFPEEVGDVSIHDFLYDPLTDLYLQYSLIQLVQTFSQSSTVITGPQHPHLHTSGNQTHPIMILFNALVTGKRIIFLGHHRPAGQVSSYVLSACALGSGCGIVLRGFIKRAFPYANLTNREEWESM